MEALISSVLERESRSLPGDPVPAKCWFRVQAADWRSFSAAGLGLACLVLGFAGVLLAWAQTSARSDLPGTWRFPKPGSPGLVNQVAVGHETKFLHDCGMPETSLRPLYTRELHYVVLPSDRLQVDRWPDESGGPSGLLLPCQITALKQVIESQR